ncbi:hypothetical protein M8C21_002311, partial [Ambrosia artemisiifolia]
MDSANLFNSRKVKDELAKWEVMISMKENAENMATASVMKRLKLQFRNKIALPVYTGMPLLGENNKPIEIALVDVVSDQIVNTGPESTAKLKILGFRVGDGDDDGSLTYKDLRETILSERERKRILQGDTCLQLKKGVCYVLNKISFTHSAEHTRNGLYRLVAVVVDACLMTRVEVAWTEAFLMKDQHNEKHAYPSLSDKVCCLKQISSKGHRYKRLKDAEVWTVKDLLRLLYTDPKRLEKILELKASCKFWDDIVKSAQASNGMFLYLDPRNEQKTGVVLDVKLQLKALIVEPHQYIAVKQLTEQQKLETQDFVTFASEHFDMFLPFDHETYLEEYLQSIRKDGPSRPSLQVAEASNSLNNLNHKPFVTTQSERGKEKLPFDDEMIHSTNQEYVSFHPATKGLDSGAASEPGTSSQAVESSLDTCEPMNVFDTNSPVWEGSRLDFFLKGIWDIVDESPNECQTNPAIVSFCAIARARWTKVSKLLRRNSVRERISLSQGIQPLKKQRHK